MGNFKYTAAAFIAVSVIGTMSVMKLHTAVPVNADKEDRPAILTGDGAGVTPAFADNDSIVDTAVDAQEEAFEQRTGYISHFGANVNVRCAPSKEAEIAASLATGDAVTVTGQDGDWYEVTLPDGTGGYVMCDLISFDFDGIKSELLNTTMYQAATVFVSGGALNVRNLPTDSGSVVVNQLANGDRVYIIEPADTGWYKIYYGADYDIGYVMADYVEPADLVSREQIKKARTDRLNSVAKKCYIVTDASYVNIRTAPSDNASISGSLKNGEACTVISTASSWAKILTGGNNVAYVTASAVMDEKAYAEYNEKKAAAARAATAAAAAAKQPAAQTQTKTQAKTGKSVTVTGSRNVSAASTTGSKIVAEAEKYIGTKYVYGGSSPAGFDCSGLVQYTMKKQGVSVGRSSRDQYKDGVAVDRTNLQAGDLVFFSKGGGISHVGIYAGAGKVIHSPSPGHTVCYTTLEHMCSYSTYVGARRVY